MSRIKRLGKIVLERSGVFGTGFRSLRVEEARKDVGEPSVATANARFYLSTYIGLTMKGRSYLLTPLGVGPLRARTLPEKIREILGFRNG